MIEIIVEADMAASDGDEPKKNEKVVGLFAKLKQRQLEK